MRYTPTKNLDPECKQMELTIWGQPGSEGVRFTDSVVECRADGIEPGSTSPSIRYISRGVNRHQFFVAMSMENSTVPVVTEFFYTYLPKLTQPMLAYK